MLSSRLETCFIDEQVRLNILKTLWIDLAPYSPSIPCPVDHLSLKSVALSSSECNFGGMESLGQCCGKKQSTSLTSFPERKK